MKTKMPSIQVAYEVIKSAKEPLTHPEIMEGMTKQGCKASGTIIYPLVERGYVKKTEKEYDGRKRTAYLVTDATPEFSQRRKRKYTKKASNKLAIAAAVDSPAGEIVRTPEQEREEAHRVMGMTYNAVRSLQNTAVTLRFAEMLEEHGPEQMLLMLSAVANMRR